MTVRLPTPGSDNGTWGTVLNDFLQVAHNTDGTLQADAVQAAGAVIASEIGAADGVAALNGTGQVPTSQLGTGTGSTSHFLRGDGFGLQIRAMSI